jgi:predicted NodU family carbamoyl transferase
MMAHITLGLSGALGHDCSAALFIDGELVAAVEEERLVRRKHAKGFMPRESARFCIRAAKIKPREIDTVAVACAPISTGTRPTAPSMRSSMAIAVTDATCKRFAGSWKTSGFRGTR